MSTNLAPRNLESGQLFRRSEICESIGCGPWLIDVLVGLYGLPRLGTRARPVYEGGDIIDALRRHSLHEVVPRASTQQCLSQKVLLRLLREVVKKESADAKKKAKVPA